MDIGQQGLPIRHQQVNKGHYIRQSLPDLEDTVFDKSIFSFVFYKDIRRVYIYKKAERLAGALYLISPAFKESMSLKSRAEDIAVALTATASFPPRELRGALSQQLLALSSILSIARVSGLLSPMNVDLIVREAQSLLAEIAAYEEPRLTLSEAPTLSALARSSSRRAAILTAGRPVQGRPRGQRNDQGQASDRQESIVSLIKDKGTASIKDISLAVRGVSEKTIQRELQSLIEAGRVAKRGERRWSTYSLT